MTKPTPLAAPPPEAYVLPCGIAGGYPMSYATLLVEPKDGYLMNRPEALNALNGLLMDELSGAGGGQRLTRFTSKAKAMELILTGRMMDAADALQAGLVSRVVPLAKELVNAAYETLLSHGIKQERRAFQSLFAFDDQKEGMAAFTEKRKPKFQGK